MNSESKVFFENLEKTLNGSYSVDDLEIEHYALQAKQCGEDFKLVVPKDMCLYRVAECAKKLNNKKLISLLLDMYYGCGYDFEEEKNDPNAHDWIKLIQGDKLVNRQIFINQRISAPAGWIKKI